MNFNQKRKMNKHAHLKWLHPYYTEEDLKRFGPDRYDDMYKAKKALSDEISKTARINGFYRREVLKAGYDDVVRRFFELWKTEEEK